MRLEGKSLKSDFFKFIIPSIIAQLVFSLYTMVDGIFVARGVSEVALTAVNISMPFSVGMFSISLLFAVGNSTIVAILLGQGEHKRANQYCTFVCDFCAGDSCCSCLFGTIRKIFRSYGQHSSLCQGLHWDNCTVFAGLHVVIFF